MFWLYEIRFPNGKKYIGCTNDYKRRWDEHIKSARTWSKFPVHCAMRHFTADGTDGGIKYVPVAVRATEEEILCLEISEIRIQNTMVPHGYNLTTGGQTSPLTNPLVAARMGATRRANGITPRMKAAFDRMKGKPKSEEHRAALRAVNMGKRASDETRAKMRLAHAERKRMPHSLETRAKISAARMGVKLGRPGPKRGITLTPEHRAKISASLTAFNQRKKAQ